MQQTQASQSAPALKRPAIRLVLMAIVLVATMATVYVSPAKAWLQDTGHIGQAVASLGLWAYPVWVLAVALLVAMGIPRLLFCTISGMLFGFWPGLLLTQFATLMGYYSIFLFVRFGGRDTVLHHFPGLKRYTALIHKQGILGVILIRQIPAPGTVINLGLGLTHLRHRDFLIGTVIGLFPEAIPLTLIGVSVRKPEMATSLGYLGTAAVLFIAVAIVVARVIRKLRESDDGTAIMEDVSSLSETEK